MIGEVWIASGQSNMTFSLDSAEGAATEVPKANFPQIRLFTVPRKIALSPQETTFPAAWKVCTPDNAKGFSAVAYFFAREIHRKLNVPVGVVESAWPGTVIEDWIAPEALQADVDLKPILDEWTRATPDEKKFAESSLPFEIEFDDFELIPATAGSSSKVLANFDDGTARLSTGGTFSYTWEDAPDAPFELVSPGHGKSGLCRPHCRVDLTGRRMRLSPPVTSWTAPRLTSALMKASGSGCEETDRFVFDRSSLPSPTGTTTPRR